MDKSRKQQDLISPHHSYHQKNPNSIQHYNPRMKIYGVEPYWTMNDTQGSCTLHNDNDINILVNDSLEITSECCNHYSDGDSEWSCESLVIDANEINLCSENNFITLNQSSITLQSLQISFACNGAPTTAALAVIADKHSCPQVDPSGSPHLGGAITQASNNITINGKGIVRQGDACPCPNLYNQVKQGINGLTINQQQATFCGAMTQHNGIIQSQQTHVKVEPYNKSTQADQKKNVSRIHYGLALKTHSFSNVTPSQPKSCILITNEQQYIKPLHAGLCDFEIDKESELQQLATIKIL